MANFINMPRLGLTMTEGVITKWVKGVGDHVEKGEIIAEIESDKSVVPFESPESGTILKLLAEETDTLDIYEPIAIIGEAGENIDGMEAGKTAEAAASEEVPQEAEAAPAAAAATAPAVRQEGKVFASPAAKRVAKENDIDIADVPVPAGKPRVTKKDVLEYIQNNHIKATPLAKKLAAENGIDLNSVEKAAGERIYSTDLKLSAAAAEEKAVPAGIAEATADDADTIIPVKGMRKVIATRMKESLDIAAHLTTVIDVDMTKIIELRKSVMDKIVDRYGVKISYNDIILKCVAAAISEYPRVNCEFTAKEIIVKKKINLGMAVANGEGLVVPVIKNADKLSLGQLAAESKRLTNKVKDTGLSPEDMSGGTFTVSNMGMYGITSFTSIINQPESAILSVGGLQKRTVVIDDEIAIRPMMTLTVSYDHRAMDGSMSAIFLKTLKEIMEDPYRIMI